MYLRAPKSSGCRLLLSKSFGRSAAQLSRQPHDRLQPLRRERLAPRGARLHLHELRASRAAGPEDGRDGWRFPLAASRRARSRQ